MTEPMVNLLENARWIRLPSDAVDNRTGAVPPDLHTFFRRQFELETLPSTATLAISADDCARLYVNGNLIWLGPAPGYLHHYYYAELDLLPYLRTGGNLLAVHNYYQGLVNRVWTSGDGFYGMIAALQLTWADGRRQTIVTDRDWRCRRCMAYVGRRTFGYETQFAEDIDQRRFPSGNWVSDSDDERGWTPAEAVSDGHYPHRLVKQETPALHMTVVPAGTYRQVASDAWLYDFGAELVGHAILQLSLPSGTVVEVRHAEELEASGRARYRLRANCEYQEFCTLDGSGRPVEFFDYKGFRYVELAGLSADPGLAAVTVRQRHYPFDPEAGKWDSGDENFNRIWTICRRAVLAGTQDSYIGCPTREKGVYLGNALVTGLAHLTLTGDGRIMKKALADFAASSVYCPGLKAVATCGYMQDIAEYSLLWAPLLREYLFWTGDFEFVRSMAPTLDGILDYFALYEGNYGLLVNFSSKPIIVDWPKNLRDDYDDPALMGSESLPDRVNTVLNLYYCLTIDAAGWLLAALGREKRAAALVKRSDRLRQAILKHLSRGGLLRDTDLSDHTSLHANALAMFCNLPPESGWDRIVTMIGRKRLNCGVFFAYFLLQGLYNIGEADLAYDLMTGEDEHSWQAMLRAGATTCMEVWSPEQKANLSWCHSWGSAPVILAAAEIFGLRPALPGWRKILFRPQLPSGLEHASIRITTPYGPINAQFVQSRNTADFTLTAPPECPVSGRFQRRLTKVRVNGKIVVDRDHTASLEPSRFTG